MKPILLFMVAVVAVVLVVPTASAASSCSISATVCKGQAYVDTSTGGVAGAIRCFFLDTDATLGNHVCSSTQDRTVWQMNSGSCVSLYYFDVVQGAVPPAVPNKVTLSVKFDTAATTIITFLSAGAEPANAATYTFCATDTGIGSGTQRAGTYRIYLNAVKDNGAGGVGNYNVDSDGTATVGAIAQFAKGALRGNMLVSALVSSTPPSGTQFAYGVAADELVTITATRSQKNGGTSTETINFDSRHASLGSIIETSTTTESAAATTDSTTFIIDNTYDAASTTYDVEYNIVSNAALTGLSWTTFPATGHGAGITQITSTKVQHTAQFTADPRIILDKTGTNTFATADNSAVIKLTTSAGVITSIFNRGETVYFESFILNARSQKLSRSMTFTAQDPTPTTCNAIGALTPTANKYSTTFTLPTTTTCTAAADSIGTSRTFLVTNTDQSQRSITVYTVSSFYWTDYHPQGSTPLVKDDFPTQNANEQVTYIISSDIMKVWCHVEGVRLDGTHIQTSSGEVSIKETETDDTTIITSLARTTGSDGWTSSVVTDTPNSPARQIHGHCDVTHNGNTGTDTQTVSWISAFTADKICQITVDPIAAPGITSRIYLNVQKAMVDITPGSVPIIKLHRVTGGNTWFDVTGQLSGITMKNVVDNTTTVNGALYYQDWNPGILEEVNILAACTIDGTQVQFGQYVHVAPPTGGDPLKVFASNVANYAGQKETFTISESFTDGTARTGNAANTFIYLYNPANTLVLNGVTPAEIQYGSYRYTYSLGTTPVLGNWIVLVKTLDPNTNSPIGTSNTFTITNQTALQSTLLLTNKTTSRILENVTLQPTAFQTLTGQTSGEFATLLTIIAATIFFWSRSRDFLVQFLMGLITIVPGLIWESLWLKSHWSPGFFLAMASFLLGIYMLIRVTFDTLSNRRSNT